MSKDFSTSNVRRHLKSRHAITAGNSEQHRHNRNIGPLDNFVVDGQLHAGQRRLEVTREDWPQQLARFVVTSPSSFSIVTENADFCELLRITRCIS